MLNTKDYSREARNIFEVSLLEVLFLKTILILNLAFSFSVRSHKLAQEGGKGKYMAGGGEASPLDTAKEEEGG